MLELPQQNSEGISSTCIECDLLSQRFVVCGSQSASRADTTRRNIVLCLWCIWVVSCFHYIEVFRTDSTKHLELCSWVKEETLQDSQVCNGNLILLLF